MDSESGKSVGRENGASIKDTAGVQHHQRIYRMSFDCVAAAGNDTFLVGYVEQACFLPRSVGLAAQEWSRFFYLVDGLVYLWYSSYGLVIHVWFGPLSDNV